MIVFNVERSSDGLVHVLVTTPDGEMAELSPERSRAVTLFTTAGFDYANGAGGACQLALAVLLYLLPSEPSAKEWTHEFKRNFLSRQRGLLFDFTDVEVLRWWRLAHGYWHDDVNQDDAARVASKDVWPHLWPPIVNEG